MFTKHHLFTLFISLLILTACTGNLPEPATNLTATATLAPIEVSTTATPIPPVKATLPAANAQPAEQSTGTWRIAGQITIPQQTMGAEFLDENFGLRVGLTGEINLTTDSGLTWTRTATSSVRSEAAPDIVNKDLIWLSGLGGRVLVSKNGGHNWEFVSLTPYTRHIEYLSFVDEQFGWAATTEVKQMWATDDGAQTWREIKMPSAVGEVKAIFRRTAGTGYILDDTATLHVTTDGGQHWSSRSIDLDMAQWTFPKRPATADLLFFDDEHGLLMLSLIGAENVVMALETFDGGQTWQQEIVPVGMGQLYLSHDGRVLTVTDLFDNTKITILQPTKQKHTATAAALETGLSNFAIPAAAWQRGIGVPYEDAGHPSVNYPMIDDGPWGGVPLGGLGAGTIGRTYRGDFARWHLDLGTHHFEPMPANQFSVFIAQGDDTQAHVLAPLQPQTLTAWNWDMPVGAGTYHALYPKAWFEYNWDVLPVNLVQKQFSPVIPGNYQESSYPVGIFEWQIENPTETPLTVGLMFTWQNLLGGGTNIALSQDGLTGITLTHLHDRVTEEWDGSMAIVAPEQPGVTLSYRSTFDSLDGTDVWADFDDNGTLENIRDTAPAGDRQITGAALAATVELAPGETRLIPFALAWDFPITEFGQGRQWYKRYTKFYGTTGREAWTIAADALKNYPAWEAQIDAWQQPILDDPNRPDWYKTALFNELYYLADGGSVWHNGQVGAEPLAEDSMGGFAYLETFDYPFYNTFDVHFYGSFALVQLWPELQKQIIRDFAATVPQENSNTFKVGYSGAVVPRKVAGAVPHDIGGPQEDPWFKVNAFTWQNVNTWKDLNSKFVLQLWRDFVFTGDESLVEEAWPAVVQALAYLHTFDRDGDGLPEHDGVPDQTYDTWPMTGASAYGGSLWLAALEAAVEMAKMMGDTEHAVQYAAWLEAGKASFEETLWNGKYYNYDSSSGPYFDSIMSDQLAGQWYADATGLPPIAPPEHIESALKTIYAYNVQQFANGEMGAVNGMRPNGQVDKSGDQSQEVWTGTTFGLAALMHHRGLSEEAWHTAWGVYNVVYNRGLWFRTPEAYLENGDYRASMYMRPLSIWAIEHALQTPSK